jgi:hypothetical protein
MNERLEIEKVLFNIQSDSPSSPALLPQGEGSESKVAGSIAFPVKSHRFTLWKFRFLATTPSLRGCRCASGFAEGKSRGTANEEAFGGVARNLTIRRTSLRDYKDVRTSRRDVSL